jgi:uncharacterized protein with von Willebrand factor type A (vWA) domain
MASEAPPLERLVALGRALREEGVPVGADRVCAFVEAASLTAPEEVYWAGRATLICRHEHIELYDRAYRRVFGAPSAARLLPPPPVVTVRASAAALAEGEVDEDARPGGAPASAVEVLRRRTFASLTDEELDSVAELARALRVALPARRTRRRTAAARGDLDLRRTLRRTLRAGGDAAPPALRDRRLRPRRLALVLDVSGSMEAHARGLLVVAAALVREQRAWEAFCFGTRLTRLTPTLLADDPREALRRSAETASDWGGGTRIGDALKTFLDRHGQSRVARGAVVVICSDGLDVGDPEILAREMERLGRIAHRIVWLNPLKEHPEYQPLARGMRAALPHVDLFASGASLEDLARVAAALPRL